MTCSESGKIAWKRKNTLRTARKYRACLYQPGPLLDEPGISVSDEQDELGLVLVPWIGALGSCI